MTPRRYAIGNAIANGIVNLAIFCSGMVFANNLSILIGTNPSYEASWWNVATAALFAILAPAMRSKR